jgi:hypothetical protein
MNQLEQRPGQPERDGIPHWVIRRAARLAPGELALRFEEEWLADLEYRCSALSRMCFSMGCCWAVLVIVGEYPRAVATARLQEIPAKGFVTVAKRNFSYFSLRSGTLFLIVGLHAALFGGLATTLTHQQVAAASNLPLSAPTPMSANIEIEVRLLGE